MARWLSSSFPIFLSLGFAAAAHRGQDAATSLPAKLAEHERDLSGDGLRFLLDEASRASFFCLGELHGENEIPALLRAAWPQLWSRGYHHIACEVSPWAADRLENAPADDPIAILGLWQRDDARFVHSAVQATSPVMWGCDMEEAQPECLVRALAALNPNNTPLATMVERTRPAYKRSLAPALLELASALTNITDRPIGGASLRDNLIATLEIDKDRLGPDTKLSASLKREALMKQLFLLHLERDGGAAPPKVMARFGRNHLHRGLDRRGVSTLGNFIAELALARRTASFHVAAFAAGGQGRLAGAVFDADERADDPAFAFLASIARHPVSVFDLRPLRPILHRIAPADRTPLHASLLYWSDSYDAIICYKAVTPLAR